MDIINKEVERNDCVICLNNLDKDDKSIITVKCCNNQFHVKCYLACMNEKTICPLCRTSYIPEQENTQLNNITILEQNPETIVIRINNENNNELQIIKRRYILCLLMTSSLIPLYYLLNIYRQMI